MAGYDIPREICPLEKRISDFSVSCGYDPMTVFNDFLMFVIHGFSPGAPPLKNWKYKRRQNIAFMEMTAEWVRLMQDRLKDDESWYDPFGDLYMSLSSRTGQRMQGQFFTPAPICDLMVACTGTGEKVQGKEDERPDLRKRKTAAGIPRTAPRKLSGGGRPQPYLLPDDRMQHAHARMCGRGHPSRQPCSGQLPGRLVREPFPYTDRNPLHTENERGRLPDRPPSSCKRDTGAEKVTGGEPETVPASQPPGTKSPNR